MVKSQVENLLRISVGRAKPERAEKCFLADRFDVLDIPEHPIQVRQDRRAVSFVQATKTPACRLLRAAHQVFVARLAKLYRLDDFSPRRRGRGHRRLGRLCWPLWSSCPYPPALAAWNFLNASTYRRAINPIQAAIVVAGRTTRQPALSPIRRCSQRRFHRRAFPVGRRGTYGRSAPTAIGPVFAAIA
jgi:hypothetical protein